MHDSDRCMPTGSSGFFMFFGIAYSEQNDCIISFVEKVVTVSHCFYCAELLAAVQLGGVGAF